MYVINSYLAKTNKSEYRMLSGSIARLSDKKLDFITECFINLAKFDFRIKFLKWFLNEKIQDEDDERIEDITVGIK